MLLGRTVKMHLSMLRISFLTTVSLVYAKYLQVDDYMFVADSLSSLAGPDVSKSSTAFFALSFHLDGRCVLSALSPHVTCPNFSKCFTFFAKIFPSAFKDVLFWLRVEDSHMFLRNLMFWKKILLSLSLHTKSHHDLVFFLTLEFSINAWERQPLPIYHSRTWSGLSRFTVMLPEQLWRMQWGRLLDLKIFR